MTSEPKTSAARQDEFAAFQQLTKKLIAVPRKELDKKLAAFKRRKKRRSRNST